MTETERKLDGVQYAHWRNRIRPAVYSQIAGAELAYRTARLPVVFNPLTPSDPVRATRLLGVEDRRPRQGRLARLQLLDLDLELGLEHLEVRDLGSLGGVAQSVHSTINAVSS